MTALEIILIISILILLTQYLITTFAFLRREVSINVAITTMEDMQKYNHELFDKLNNEQKLTNALASELKQYRFPSERITGM